MINAAMIGLGWWGRHIVGCLKESNKIKVVRGVDMDVAPLAGFGAEHGLELSTDLAEVLADPAIDAVLLATPHSLHEPQIVAAAEAGKHVFCEKPLALSRAAAQRAVDACNAADVQLGLGHERRFEPGMVEIKRLVDTGALGTVLHVESSFSHDILANVPSEGWRASAKEAPAAGLTATGIHHSDLYLHMFGPIEEVYAQTARRAASASAGDILSIQFRFESGMTGYFSSLLTTPLFLRYRVFGSDAWVESRDSTHPSELGVTTLTICRGKGEESRTLDDIDTVRANIEAFADAVEGKQNYPFTDAQKVQNIAVLEAVIRSAESGKPIQIE